MRFTSINETREKEKGSNPRITFISRHPGITFISRHPVFVSITIGKGFTVVLLQNFEYDRNIEVVFTVNVD